MATLLSIQPAMPDREQESGYWERREASARRRRNLAVSALLAIGVGIGFYVGRTERDVLFNGMGAWSPALSLGLLGLLIIVMTGGILLGGRPDEHQQQVWREAVTAAALVNLVGYPVWFLLWKGGFVIEPLHSVIYVAFLVALAVGAGFYRWR